MIVIDVPEWRIVDDETWLAVQDSFKALEEHRLPLGPRTRYALSGLARCAACGGSVGVQNTRIGKTNVKTYGCDWHRTRGNAVCSVKTRKPVALVEDALFSELEKTVLSEDLLQEIMKAAPPGPSMGWPR